MRKDHTGGHANMLQGPVISKLANCNAVKMLVRIESGKEVSKQRMVVPITKTFDVIHESHRSIGHLCEERTYADASKKCYKVYQAFITIFFASCCYCNKKHPSNKAVSLFDQQPIANCKYSDYFYCFCWENS